MRSVALSVLILASCTSEDATLRKLWGGLESTLESPSKVEAFRIESGIGSSSKPNFDYTTWPVAAGPVAVDAASSKELVTLLRDPRSYSHGPPKACKPVPGVKLAFTSAVRTVWVYFCFECEILMVYQGNAPRGEADFDPSAPAFAAVLKKLFPQDRVIQALK